MTGARLPSLDGLRAFEAVARLGTVERAAEELHITASAVSKRLSGVEDLLEESLFQRRPNALVLTPAGHDYLRQIQPLLHALAQIPMHRRGAAVSNRVRITTPPTFARQVLVPRLHEFTERHPDIDIEVVLTMAVLDLPPTEADVEIRNGDARQDGRVQLMHDLVVPMAAPQLLATLGAPAGPADLLGMPLIRSPLERWTTWFASAGLACGEPTHGPQLVDLGLAIEAAVAGQGVALLRPTLVSRWLAAGTLRPLLDIKAAPANQYYLLPVAAQPAAQAFAAWLRSSCQLLETEAAACLRSALRSA